MSEYMNTLRISGYDEQYRKDVIKGVDKLDRIENEKVLNGERKRFRSATEIAESKKEKHGGHSDTWFLAMGYTNVMKVQFSKDGALVKAAQEAANRVTSPDGGKLKVVELTGRPVVMGLKMNDPYETNQCPYPDKCVASEKTNCMKKGVVYDIECLLCSREEDNPEAGPESDSDEVNKKATIYRGTTGHTLHKRTSEHTAAVRRRKGDLTSSVAKHMKALHPGKDPTLSASILDSDDRNLYRMVKEALHIEDAMSTHILMNQKSELGRRRLPRLMILGEDTSQHGPGVAGGDRLHPGTLDPGG